LATYHSGGESNENNQSKMELNPSAAMKRLRPGMRGEKKENSSRQGRKEKETSAVYTVLWRKNFR